MWNVLVLLLMHLLGAADSVVASYVFVIIYVVLGLSGELRSF
jgi:hypothetical protein